MIKNWYIKYNEDISPELFNKLEEKLSSVGLERGIHIGNVSYENFKKNGFLRALSEWHDRKYEYCVDNNRQWGLEELSINDILYGQEIDNYQIF